MGSVGLKSCGKLAVSEALIFDSLSLMIVSNLPNRASELKCALSAL